MFFRLLALFLLTPVIDLALLIQLGDWIGFWPTIGIILVTGFAGTYLARREGMSAWRRFRTQLEQGGLPGKELVDGVIILVAGALLITPGVITDLIGFLGLLPFTRAFIRKLVWRRATRALERGTLHVGFGGGWGAPGASSSENFGWRGEPSNQPGHQDRPPPDLPPGPSRP